jgi:hypothetical protein
LVAGASSIGRYIVPADTKVALKTIGFSAAKPQRCVAVNPSNGNNTGTVFIKVGGTTVFEFRIYGESLPSDPAAEDGSNQWYCPNQLLHFRDLIIPSGTALTITATPTVNSQTNWNGGIVGKLGTTPYLEKVDFETYTTTADQTIYSYTPGSDLTLLSIRVEGYIATQVCCNAAIYLDGNLAFDIGRVGMEESAVSPMVDTSGCGTYGSGGFFINMWGIDAYPGTGLETRIQSWVPDSSEYQGFVFGQSSALGGGTPPMKVFIGT